MTKGAKGRGDAAPSLSPSSILELSRDWPRYAKALRLLRKAPAPTEHDKLRLAKHMIEVCENCDSEGLEETVGYNFDRTEELRSLKSDTKAARKAARDLARIIRRHHAAPELSAAIQEAVWVGACRYIIEEQNEIILEQANETGKNLSEAAREAKISARLAGQENAMKAAHDAGLDYGLRVCDGFFIAAVLEDFAENLPKYIEGFAGEHRRRGIRFKSSLLRKGRSADALTDCLFGLVFHARLATGAGRDAWANAADIRNAGPMPKDGEPLYDIVAAFASAAFKLEEGDLDEKRAADRLRRFLIRNPGAEFEGYQVKCFLWE
ncbi:MAG: hypothetical protein INF65_13140 [Roseomonas sp.]|nr:hypothetical protein [Roseomonas sp.]MCA3389565.1 hypothetical protein [Roseomonas sp.]MCA3391559.1 hypothetical protein [Roseomonas sp.]MCA3407200.1 hypothetical protein [Roseomonas sp.]